jgi:hypothetical protein
VLPVGNKGFIPASYSPCFLFCGGVRSMEGKIYRYMGVGVLIFDTGLSHVTSDIFCADYKGLV